MFSSYKRYVTGLGIIVLLFAGCDRPTGFQPDDTPEIVESSFGEATLGEGTTIVDEETMEKLTEVSEDGTVFTFQGTDPILEAIEQKEFLVMGSSALTPLGALRRIEEVRIDGDIYEVKTSDATLEEAFESLEIRYNELLTPEQVDSIIYKVPSLDIHKKMTRKTHPEVLDLAFSISVDQDFGILTVGGQLVLEPSVDFHLRLRRFRLRELHMIVENELTNELTVSAVASQSIKAERIIFEYWFTPIYLGYVTLTPKISVKVGIDGQASAGITSGVEATLTMEGGVRYENQNWVPVSDFTPGFTAYMSENEVNASLKAYLGPQIDFYLYGFAGPSVGVEGYGEMTWDMNRNPRYQVHAGIDASAGVKMDIISLITLSYTWPDLYNYRRLIYEAGFHEDDDGEIEITTKPVTNITKTSAESGGVITDDSGQEITQRGVCWSTAPEPDLTDDCTQDGSGTGNFTSQLSGLDPSTSYYLRAYATNSSGTAYGDELDFETREDDDDGGIWSFLSLNVSPSGSGSVSGSGEYEEGTTVTITATANSGYSFVNWSGDTGYVADENSASTTVSIPASDITLTANFEQEDDNGDIGDWPRDTETEVVEVTSPTGRVWMDRNLGASRAAASSTDSQAYGDLYQWGRAADGHQKRNSSTTSTRSSTDQPGHDSFITSSSGANLDWRNPQNDNLWQGLNGVNNPCPAGYRLPTEAEWNAERNSWSSNNAAGAYASPLKLPMAGGRGYSSGSLFFVGSLGRYWSSTVSGSLARGLRFASGNASMHSYNRANGGSVRCTKD